MYGLIIKGVIALCITSFISYELLTSESSLFDLKSELVQKMTTGITDDLDRAMPLIHEAGYKVFAIQAQLSLPPRVNAIFERETIVEPRKQKIILEALQDNAIGKLVLESLIDAFALNKKVSIKNMKLKKINITIGLPPSVQMDYR